MKRGRVALYQGLQTTAKTPIARLAYHVAYDRLTSFEALLQSYQHMQLAFVGDGPKLLYNPELCAVPCCA